MKIYGKYETDENFITVYSDNAIYTIARNTGNWNCRAVGEKTAMGQILTQEAYDKWMSECTEEGSFELSDERRQPWFKFNETVSNGGLFAYTNTNIKRTANETANETTQTIIK